MKGWKTIAINVLTLIVTVAAWPQVIALVDPQYLMAVMALANMGLRYITTTPIGQVHG
jgi:hypothetical protein